MQVVSPREQQRVAIARCLAGNTKVIVADEPTGSLDTDNANEVIRILFSLAKTQNLAVILVTHDTTIARRADVLYSMDRGRLRVAGEAGV